MSRRAPLGYQPALDGVRAFAVIAVMLYHSGLAWARGGYLGVDIFFALSGFLITGLLIAEWDRWQHLDLLAFWGRRARRLLPALVLVILAVAVYAWTLPAGAGSAIRGDGLSSLFYVANWRYIVEGQSYFDQFTEPSPFKHTWSLAIEEQFYLVFPLVLLLLLAWLGRRWGRLALVLLLGSVLSALLMSALYVPGEDPSRAYYGTDTRIQTLLVGAALAAVLPRLRAGAVARRVAPWVSVVAGAGLVAAVVLVSDSDPRMYHGGFLVVAVLSTCLIAGLVVGGGPLRWLLERRAVVRIGVISYGLYLWHWPVFVWLNPDRVQLSGPALLALRFLLTFVLAALSYEFVEQPIRSGSFGRLPVAARLRGAAAAVAVTVAAVLIGTSGISGAAAAAQAPVASSGSTETTHINAMLVGDSVPLGLAARFDASAAPGLSVGGSFRLGCGITPDPRAIDGLTIPQPADCPPWQKVWPGEVSAPRPAVIALFLGVYEQFDRVVDGKVITFGTSEYSAYLTRTFDSMRASIAASGARVALVNAPCRKVLDLGTSPDPAISNDPSRIAWLNSWAAAYTADPAHSTSLVDLHGYLCSRGYEDVVGGVKLRDDGLHFSVEGASYVWRFLGTALRGIVSGTPGTTPSGSGTSPLSVFLLGDSNTYALRSGWTTNAAPGLVVTGSTELGCGLFPQTLVAEDKVIPPAAPCAGWVTRRAAEAAATKPDVGVLVAGSWEQYDREVNGTVLKAGTPAFESDLAARFAAELTMLGKVSRHVVILTDHCHRTPDLGVGPEPHIVNDDTRVASVNRAVRLAAAQVKTRVTVIDVNAFLCADGFTPTKDGVNLRVDGLHYTPQGAALVWAWLAPQLRRAAA